MVKYRLHLTVGLLRNNHSYMDLTKKLRITTVIKTGDISHS